MQQTITMLHALQLQSPHLYFWLDVLFKTCLLFLLALVFCRLLRRQSAASHGLIWLTALLAALLIPLLKLLIPDLSVGITVPSQASDSVTPMPAWLSSTLVPVALVYLAGTLALAAYLGAGIWRLLLLTRQAIPVRDVGLIQILTQLHTINGMSAPVNLMICSHTDTPFTWGVFRHRLILPVEALGWDENLARQAISHELGHVQRNDWFFQLLGRLALCLYWPNPLAWYAVRSLKIESEKACDDAAVDCTGCDLNYADNLLRLARAARQRPLLPVPGLFGNPSMLALRIRHILSGNQNREFLRTDEIAVTSVLILLLVIPLSVLRVSVSVAETPELQLHTLPLVFHVQSNAGPLDSLARDASGLTIRPETLAPAQLVDAPRRQAAVRNVGPVLPLRAESDGFVLSHDDLYQSWEAAPLQIHLPDYPITALKKGIEGYVVAEYTVNASGQVQNPIIIESVPTGTFDRSVLRALEQFVYCTEVVNGIGGNNQLIRKRFSFNLQPAL